MPTSFAIHDTRRLVLSRAWGAVSDADILRHYARLEADPGFDAQFDQLCDLQEVTHMEASTSLLRTLATAFSQGSLRAFVAPRDYEYGVCRMFQSLCEGEGIQVEVFREFGDALDWIRPTDAAPDGLDRAG